MTRFAKINPDGEITDEREIPQSAVLACPHFIIVAEHYRDDNTCRCDDPTHTEMRAAGYVWSGKEWK
jgi:hypothetical protein